MYGHGLMFFIVISGDNRLLSYIQTIYGRIAVMVSERLPVMLQDMPPEDSGAEGVGGELQRVLDALQDLRAVRSHAGPDHTPGGGEGFGPATMGDVALDMLGRWVARHNKASGEGGEQKASTPPPPPARSHSRPEGGSAEGVQPAL